MASFEARTLRLAGGGQVVLRAGVPDDAPAMLDHKVHIAQTSPHGVARVEEIEHDLEKERQWLAERLERPYDLFLVVVSDDAPGLIIGSLHFHSYKWKTLAHHGDFGISVHDTWRGKGIGSLMIRALLDWARVHPTIEKVCLGVYEDNHAARRLYERLGFTEEGRRVKFFKTERGYVDDIMMSVWVKGVE